MSISFQNVTIDISEIKFPCFSKKKRAPRFIFCLAFSNGLVHVSRSSEDRILEYPVEIGTDSRVYARKSRFAAPDSPGNYSHGDPPAVVQSKQQRPTRVALRTQTPLIEAHCNRYLDAVVFVNLINLRSFLIIAEITINHSICPCHL